MRATPAFAPGLRHAAGTTRHLLYSTQGRDIDLRIVPQSGRFAIVGQILGPDASGAVELRPVAGDASSQQTVQLDDLGEFRLGDQWTDERLAAAFRVGTGAVGPLKQHR